MNRMSMEILESLNEMDDSLLKGAQAPWQETEHGRPAARRASLKAGGHRSHLEAAGRRAYLKVAALLLTLGVGAACLTLEPVQATIRGAASSVLKEFITISGKTVYYPKAWFESRPSWPWEHRESVPYNGPENVKPGDIIEGPDGRERVFAVSDDGAFLSELLDETEAESENGQKADG